MSSLNCEGNRQIYQIGIIFFLVGVIFIAIGGGGLENQLRTRKSSQSTMATITAMHSNWTEVEYKVEGKTYTANMNYTSSAHYIGDTITVYFKPEQPEKVFLNIPVFYLMFLIPGLILMIISIVLLMHYTRRTKRKKYLLENGQCIYAEIIGLENNYHLKRNNFYAKTLVCQYQAPDGTIHIFESDPVWFNFSNNMKSDVAAVYVEYGNFDQYYVDLSSVVENVVVHVK